MPLNYRYQNSVLYIPPSDLCYLFQGESTELIHLILSLNEDGNLWKSRCFFSTLFQTTQDSLKSSF